MIEYTCSVESIIPVQLQGFFAGWPHPPSPQTHLHLLQNSSRVALALDSETGKVVGFITAITDGVLSAHIPLLEVLPAYQHQGIGKILVETMLEQLRGLYMIDLLCDPDLQPFYQQLGMKPAVGMMLRNYDRQAAE